MEGSSDDTAQTLLFENPKILRDDIWWWAKNSDGVQNYWSKINILEIFERASALWKRKTFHGPKFGVNVTNVECVLLFSSSEDPFPWLSESIF